MDLAVLKTRKSLPLEWNITPANVKLPHFTDFQGVTSIRFEDVKKLAVADGGKVTLPFTFAGSNYDFIMELRISRAVKATWIIHTDIHYVNRILFSQQTSFANFVLKFWMLLSFPTRILNTQNSNFTLFIDSWIYKFRHRCKYLKIKLIVVGPQSI